RSTLFPYTTLFRSKIRQRWPLSANGRGRGMKGVELYAQVRFAVQIEGVSRREAAHRFGIDPRTVARMLAYSVPPGYWGEPAAGATEAGPVHRDHRRDPGR